MAEQIIPIEAEFTLLKKKAQEAGARSSPRYRFPLATLGRLFFPASGETREVWVHNLSRTGIGMKLENPLEVDTALVVRLRGTEKDLRVEIPARVVHSTAEVDGTWRIGAQFHEKLEPGLVDDLL